MTKNAKKAVLSVILILIAIGITISLGFISADTSDDIPEIIDIPSTEVELLQAIDDYISRDWKRS